MSQRYSTNQSRKFLPRTQNMKYFYKPQSLSRRQIIKNIAQKSLGKTLAKSSCFINLPSLQIPKTRQYKSFRTGRSQRMKNLKFGQFRASNVKSLQSIKSFRAKSHLRILTQSNPESVKINNIKTKINQIIINNRFQNNVLIQNEQSYHHIDTSQEMNNQSTMNIKNLKATQQYYNIKQYYEQKYSSR